MRLFAASGAPGTLVCLARMLLTGAPEGTTAAGVCGTPGTAPCRTKADMQWSLGCPPALREWLVRAVQDAVPPSAMWPEGVLVDLPAVDAPDRDATLRRLLDGADSVLTGTDLGDCIDEHVALMARRAGLPVTYYIDFATCVPQRVAQMHPGPGVVLAPGTMVAADLVRAGCPMPVVDCGHPEFERLLAVAPHAGEAIAARIRREAGLAPETLLVAYFSQPFSDHRTVYQGADLPFLDGGRLGYDELSIYDAVHAALCTMTRPAALLVQPHPREARGKYADRVACSASRKGPYRDVWQGPKDELLLAADVVLGMQSTVLVEAVYLGKPVASLDIGALYGAGEPSPFAAASWGMACIDDMARLRAGLDDVRTLLPVSRNPLGIRPGCAERLLETLQAGAAEVPAATGARHRAGARVQADALRHAGHHPPDGGVA